MAFAFEGVSLTDIGDSTAHPDLMWASLYLHIEDSSTGQIPTVRVRLPVPRHPETTIAQLQTAARETALEVLREAVRLLEGASLEQLAERQRSQDQARRQALAEHQTEALAKALLGR